MKGGFRRKVTLAVRSLDKGLYRVLCGIELSSDYYFGTVEEAVGSLWIYVKGISRIGEGEVSKERGGYHGIELP